MVSHNTIKDDIMKIYEVEKGKMSSYLEKLETRIAITTDMWTSNQKKGYMAITVKPRENPIFSKKGKIVISVKIRNFSRSRMTKRTFSLKSSCEV